MAAKSILNEFCQSLRTAPVYRTQAAQDGSDGFLCTLMLPAVHVEGAASLAEEQQFEGTGSSKKVGVYRPLWVRDRRAQA